jgi:3-phenylpropionate/cinnamic acid dioxygenase small subunit
MTATEPGTTGLPLSECPRELEAFIYREAHALDEADFTTWLSLFTDEAIYWVSGDHDDPTRGISLIYDNKAHLAERIARLQAGKAASQSPPTLTTHVVSAVLLRGSNADGLATCISKQVIFYARGERSGSLPATVQHEVATSASGFVIARKRISLLTRRQPVPDLSFIL